MIHFSPKEVARQVEEFQADYAALVEQIGHVIVGQADVVEGVLSCLLSGGHALLEGVPGIGKTLLVRALAEAADLSFARIQFTPDLMPADILGTEILQIEPDGRKALQFRQGPIFANLVLADEINRATPKTQSAVLEAMQEATVSVSRTTHALPQPFCVLATQNPIEMEGTYPLPEAQRDRFLLKLRVLPPAETELAAILDRTTGEQTPAARKVVTAGRLEEHKQLVRQVPAASHIGAYIARLVAATHPDHEAAPPLVKTYVRYGSSPRGAQAMMLAGRVAALRNGRANVAAEDVRKAAPAALRHRLILNFQAQADGVNTEDVIAELLETVSPK
jgi:MoxR-like ATPase